MKFTVVDTGTFKLDGGAMFGVVPKAIWNRLTPADQNNLCTWAARCLLIEVEDRKILIDTGLGNKQDEKFRSYFHPSNNLNITDHMQSVGVDPESITDVIITHMHFDHVGGALYRDINDEILPSFPNAHYWSSKTHFEWATHPNAREKASFLKENILPLQQMGILKFLPERGEAHPFSKLGISMKFVHGHTEAMMLPVVNYLDKTLVFCADLLPSSFHVKLPYVMAYDIRPLQTLQEKEVFLQEAVEHKHILFFEHDPIIECATLKLTDHGRYAVDQFGPLSDFI